jgi:hypothetical protein
MKRKLNRSMTAALNMKDVPLDKQGCPYQKQNYVAVIQNC